jgi:hypothetical protein
MGVFGDILHQKNIKNFNCEKCDFLCSKKGDWNRHIMTTKHIKLTLANGQGDIGDKKNIYACDICNKNFMSRNGLWKHKKNICIESNISKENITPKEVTDKELIIMLIKQNTELMGQNTELMDMLKNNTTNQISCNNINSLNNNNNNNKTFNLHFFLNETCKDAMNIMDFVDSIKLQLSDLEKVGEVGYTQGISNIITSNLKALDVTQRPVHCTDKKRETMYIKDQNKWEKEDENKTKLRKAIKRVANKNIRLLPQFREKNPDYSNSSSRTSDKYDKMVIEAMGGEGVNDLEKEDKIIHNISNCVVIDKYNDMI